MHDDDDSDDKLNQEWHILQKEHYVTIHDEDDVFVASAKTARRAKRIVKDHHESLKVSVPMSGEAYDWYEQRKKEKEKRLEKKAD